MKRFLALAVAAVLALGVSSVVYANVCAFDPVPAATLLFPFVQLDFNNPVDGDTTLFSITNVSNEAQIVHITIWTDDSTPIFDFNLLLSGYDVQSFNIRDILVLGDLPNTGVSTTTVGLDNYDVVLGDWVSTPFANIGATPLADGPVSPNGYGGPAAGYIPPSQGTAALAARCPTTATAYPNYPIIPDSTLAVLQFYLTYTQALGDAGMLQHADCDGGYYGVTPDDWWQARSTTQPTWMYITADVVQSCNLLFPTQPSYWLTQARYDNVLIGDLMWVNTAGRFSEAVNAVHLEADEDIAAVVGDYDAAGPITFYNRGNTSTADATGFYAPSGIDYREPLPNAWAFRYLGAGTDDIDTWIRVWKNHNDFTERANGNYAALDCQAYTYYAWDEHENYLTTTGQPWSAPVQGVYIPNLLPLEVQEVEVDQFDTPDANGWMLFIWPDANVAATAQTEESYYQTWMAVKYGAYGQFSAALTGAVMANTHCFPTQDVESTDGQVLGVNFDYVWSTGYAE